MIINRHKMEGLYLPQLYIGFVSAYISVA